MNILNASDLGARKTDPTFGPIEPPSADLASPTILPKNQPHEKKDFREELFRDNQSDSPSARPPSSTKKTSDKVIATPAVLSDRSLASKSMDAKRPEKVSTGQDVRRETKNPWKEKSDSSDKVSSIETVADPKGMPNANQQGTRPTRPLHQDSVDDDPFVNKMAYASPRNTIPAQVQQVKTTTGPDSSISSPSPAINFLEGRLDQINPAAIPQVISGNSFITDALAAADVNQFLNAPLPLEKLAKDLGIDASQITKMFEQNQVPEYLTPNELFKYLNIDRNRVGAELSLLKANLQFDGLSSYMQRATLITEGDGRSETKNPIETDQLNSKEKKQKQICLPFADLNQFQPNQIGQVQQVVETDFFATPSEKMPLLAAAPLSGYAPFFAAQQIQQSQEPVNPLTLGQGFSEQQVAPSPVLQPELTAVLPNEQKISAISLEKTGRTSGQSPIPFVTNGFFETQVDPFEELGAMMDPLTLQAIKAQPSSSTFLQMDDAFAATNASTLVGMNDNQGLDTLRVIDSQTELWPTPDISNRNGMPVPPIAQFKVDVLSVTSEPSPVQPSFLDNSKPVTLDLPFDYRRELLSADQIPSRETKAVLPTEIQTLSYMGSDSRNVMPAGANAPEINPNNNIRLASAFFQDQKDNRTNDPQPKLVGTAPVAFMPVSSEDSKHSSSGSQSSGQQDADQNNQQQSHRQITTPPLMAETKLPNSPTHAGQAITKQSNAVDPALRAQIVQNIMDNSSIMLKKGGGSVRLDLSSRELGTLDIAVKVVDNKLDLNILTHSQHTRDLIIADIPRLRESLQAQNLNLSDVNISVGSGNSLTQSFSDGSANHRSYFQEYQERAADNSRSSVMSSQSVQTLSSPKQWDNYRQPHAGKIQVLV